MSFEASAGAENSGSFELSLKLGQNKQPVMRNASQILHHLQDIILRGQSFTVKQFGDERLVSRMDYFCSE
jgi:hypothetical protein